MTHTSFSHHLAEGIPPPPDVIVSASSPLGKDTADLPGRRSAVSD